METRCKPLSALGIRIPLRVLHSWRGTDMWHEGMWSEVPFRGSAITAGDEISVPRVEGLRSTNPPYQCRPATLLAEDARLRPSPAQSERYTGLRADGKRREDRDKRTL